MIFIIIHRNRIACEKVRLDTSRFFSFEKIHNFAYGQHLRENIISLRFFWFYGHEMSYHLHVFAWPLINMVVPTFYNRSMHLFLRRILKLLLLLFQAILSVRNINKNKKRSHLVFLLCLKSLLLPLKYTAIVIFIYKIICFLKNISNNIANWISQNSQ